MMTAMRAPFGHFNGDAARAHIPGDMAGHILRRQAKIAARHVRRHAVGGVIAKDDPGRVAGFADQFEG